MSFFRREKKIALVGAVSALVLLAACTFPSGLEPPPVAQQSPARNGLERLKTSIAASVAPAEKGERMAGLVDRLQQLVAALERETRSYNDRLARLLADERSTRADFLQLRASLEAKRFAVREEMVDTLFALKAMSGRATWERLAAAAGPIGLFVVEDPQRLQGAYQSLANLVRQLSPSERRDGALAVLERGEREAGPLDARLAQAVKQDERLFVSYDVRPDTFRVAIRRLKDARDAVHDHLLETVMTLRDRLSAGDWRQMF